METPENSACSIQASLDVLGDRWTILILRDAFRGVRRFDDFRKDLSIARPVLTDRLKRLVERGVLVRHLYCERPPRYEYRLTQMGMALSPTLVALMRWGDAWLSEGDAPTVLVHTTCGHPLDQQFVCWNCDETFTQYDIASRPGPGMAEPTIDPNSHDSHDSDTSDSSIATHGEHA
ncbi:MAG: DNA-binding HxlR family transcriptional regulator [Ilumatobacter sp.]|jgi:DNA-binding HxlR family transcriptional regulator